jgi:hypothetical protein
MKRKLLLCLLLACACTTYAQYDSAIRYRMASPTFYVAADALLPRAVAANPADTTEGGPANELVRYQNFMGNHIRNDVPMGGNKNRKLILKIPLFNDK